MELKEWFFNKFIAMVFYHGPWDPPPAERHKDPKMHEGILSITSL